MEKVTKYLTKKNIIIGGGVLIVLIIAYFLFKTYTVKSTAGTQGVPNSAGYIPTTIQMKVEDVSIGTGKEVKKGDTVVINYKGMLTNGTVFDSSYTRGQPFETQIGVGKVIRGWDEGVVGMKVGGKRRLTIPSELAYGSQAVGPIPANSTLVFDLELVDVK